MEERDNFEITDEKDEQEVYVKYDITTYPSDFTLSGLNAMWKNGDILIPDYQREFVWKIKQSSLLIESFLIGLPVPPIFLYVDSDNKNLVVDGQQRLLSIFYFFEGYFGRENEKGKRTTFRLTGLNENNPYYNKRYVDLEDRDKRKLELAVLRAMNIRQLSPNDQNTSVYHIFERLNTGGTALRPQEIRNCVYRGRFLDELKKLNLNMDWRKIIGRKLPDVSQGDVELILRAFGLCNDLANYEKPMKEFLNKTAHKYQDGKSSLVSDFAERFNKASAIIAENMRAKPFSVRGPLNTSVFDSVFCTIISNIEHLPDDISERYEKLVEDTQFIEYTSLATSDEKIVKARFKYVKDKLIEV